MLPDPAGEPELESESKRSELGLEEKETHMASLLTKSESKQ